MSRWFHRPSALPWPSERSCCYAIRLPITTATLTRMISSTITPMMLPTDLEGLASVVVAQEQAALAAHLLAATSALRAQMGTPIRPIDQAGVEQTLATARSTLGDDAFAAVWAETQTLLLEQILSTIPTAAALAVLGDRSRS